jgi:hypothetical protein
MSLERDAVLFFRRCHGNASCDSNLCNTILPGYIQNIKRYTRMLIDIFIFHPDVIISDFHATDQDGHNNPVPMAAACDGHHGHPGTRCRSCPYAAISDSSFPSISMLTDTGTVFVTMSNTGENPGPLTSPMQHRTE